jgi:tetratricopeptide (TPR) repeat protein
VPNSTEPKAPPTRKYALAGVFAVAVFAAGLAGVYWAAQRDRARVERARPASAAYAGPATDAEVFAAYGTSPSCRSCHEAAYHNWEKSHHALAERPVDPVLDRAAFDPPWRIPHGSQHSVARRVDGQFQLVTQGPHGTNQPFAVTRVIGVDPLRQFLIPFGDGRLQASELCFDPNHPGWFDVYGEEDRRPGEWGHWTGRGMNWNNMCGTCHNTRFRKNYVEPSDTYQTKLAEMGVGCEACHGPMADHNAWQARHPNQTGDPTVRKITREEMFSVCAQCHSRRAELTGHFRPGENYFDHHYLTIPDETDLFYPDGQIRDEDYEVTAFLGSKMHAAGVRCVDCHEPHTAKLRVPGNDICLVCHGGAPAGVAPAGKDAPNPAIPPNARTAPATNAATTPAELPLAWITPKIDPKTHSRHKAGERGDFCTDCHMPQTVYMQRHARHDHGFTLPDPRLTKELGIPNACNRCHTDQSADWSLDAIVKWYGPRTNDAVRLRARAVAKARAGDPGASEGLLRMVHGETNYFWRAVAANLLKPWSAEPPVTAALLAGLSETNELVRAMAVRGLEPLAQSANGPVRAALRARLNDPVRAVRVEAAWALHATVDTNSPAGAELLAYLRHNYDQPAGALQMGVFLMDRGELASALDYFRRAVKWDPYSAPLYHALAVALSADGKAHEAVDALETACRLAPREAEYQFKLGLALNEVNRLNDACAALKRATELDPRYARAWYNLGLAYSGQGKDEPALEALLRAESLDPNSPEIPYARATILARLGRMDEARRAAQRAVELNGNFQAARQLLDNLGH